MPEAIQPYSCDDAMTTARLVNDAPPFEQWKEQNAHKLDDGGFIFEGDILIHDEGILRAIYLERYQTPTTEDRSLRFRNIVACSGGFDATWNVHEKLDLTYCFGHFPTPGLQELVASSLERAAYEWERAGDVNFIHIQDMTAEECECIFPDDLTNSKKDCLSYSTQARIRIREVPDSECGSECNESPASAGYPHDPVQEVRVHSSAVFRPFLPPNVHKLTRVLRHELGHTLGLRHEHIRYGQALGDCDEDMAWRVVTPPDSDSIMGYGPCLGAGGLIFSEDELSAGDRQGVAYLYNLPRNEFPSFTSDTIDDLLWFTPNTGEYVLWRATPNPGAAVTFAPEDMSTFCAATDNGICDLAQQRTRPIPVSLTEDGLTDVISYGPGNQRRSAFFHTPSGPLSEDSPNITDTHPFDLPIAGQFFGDDEEEELWWVRPGVQTDPLGRFVNGTYTVADAEDYGSGPSSDQFFRPLVGLWLDVSSDSGSNRPNSQVVWYKEPADNENPFAPFDFRLSFQSSGFTAMTDTVLSTACGLSSTTDPIALRGDFDGDEQMEILWASPDDGHHVLWADPNSMWNGNILTCLDSNVVRHIDAPMSFAKPFVGDFDGDGSDDIYWYRAGSLPDVIWLDIGGIGGPNVLSPLLVGAPDPLIGDFSPVVGDFNGDLCDDILWFSPDSDYEDLVGAPTTGGDPAGHPGNSALWRSNCDTLFSFSGFTLDEIPSHPSDAYPVGYDPRLATRRASGGFSEP